MEGQADVTREMVEMQMGWWAVQCATAVSYSGHMLDGRDRNPRSTAHSAFSSCMSPREKFFEGGFGSQRQNPCSERGTERFYRYIVQLYRRIQLYPAELAQLKDLKVVMLWLEL